MTNEEFLRILERINPIENPKEEKKLLDESFKEGFAALMEGDDVYESWDKALDENLEEE